MPKGHLIFVTMCLVAMKRVFKNIKVLASTQGSYIGAQSREEPILMRLALNVFYLME